MGNDRLERPCRWVLLFVGLGLFLGGCKGRRSSDIEKLNALSQASWMPADAKERVLAVVKAYKDRRRDATPTLIVAVLEKPSEDGSAYLNLWMFDETKDLLRIGVRHVWRDPNGASVTLEERYPVYSHLPSAGAYTFGMVPACIRTDASQRKDEKAWADYLAMDFDKLTKQAVAGVSSQERGSAVSRLWESTLPAVWISSPYPAAGETQVYLYDKAGHQSNAVNVLSVAPTHADRQGGTE